MPAINVSRATWSFLATVTLAGCGTAGAEDSAGRDTAFRGVVLAEPLVKADFTLTDTEGRPFRFRERTDGHLTLLFFGYTNCPDICPVHMANVGEVLRRFPHDVRSRVKVVFVTTDPDRDSPEVIRRWLDAFDAAFIGLTGPVAEVDRIQLLFGLAPATRDEAETGDAKYLVGHAAQVIAFTPDDVGRVVYPFGTRQADWVLDIPKLLAHRQSGT